MEYTAKDLHTIEYGNSDSAEWQLRKAKRYGDVLFCYAFNSFKTCRSYRSGMVIDNEFALASQLSRLLGHISRFRGVLEGLTRHLHVLNDASFRQSLLLLKAHTIMIYVYVSPCLSIEEVQRYDAYTGDFCEILMLAHEFLSMRERSRKRSSIATD